jgi:hypothetical protein
MAAGPVLEYTEYQSRPDPAAVVNFRNVQVVSGRLHSLLAGETDHVEKEFGYVRRFVEDLCQE